MSSCSNLLVNIKVLLLGFEDFPLIHLYRSNEIWSMNHTCFGLNTFNFNPDCLVHSLEWLCHIVALANCFISNHYKYLHWKILQSSRVIFIYQHHFTIIFSISIGIAKQPWFSMDNVLKINNTVLKRIQGTLDVTPSSIWIINNLSW